MFFWPVCDEMNVCRASLSTVGVLALCCDSTRAAARTALPTMFWLRNTVPNSKMPSTMITMNGATRASSSSSEPPSPCRRLGGVVVGRGERVVGRVMTQLLGLDLGDGVVGHGDLGTEQAGQPLVVDLDPHADVVRRALRAGEGVVARVGAPVGLAAGAVRPLVVAGCSFARVGDVAARVVVADAAHADGQARRADAARAGGVDVGLVDDDGLDLAEGHGARRVLDRLDHEPVGIDLGGEDGGGAGTGDRGVRQRRGSRGRRHRTRACRTAGS